jgi:hypothetical protein
MFLLTSINYIYLASSHRAGDKNLRQYNFYNPCASKVATVEQNQVGHCWVLSGPAPVYECTFLLIC